MPERLKKIQAKLLEFWSKYTKKQRAIFLGIVGGVIVLLVVLIIILSRTRFMDLATFTDKTTAANAVSTLNQNGIKSRLVSNPGSYTVQVDEKSEIQATVLITGTYGESEFFSLDQLLNNSLTTTDSDRRLKNDLYIRSEIEAGLEKMNGIANATVIFYPRNEMNTVFTKANDIACSVVLETRDKISSKTAENLAQLIATALGNKDVKQIKIMDQDMNLLFGAVKTEEEETLSQREQWMRWITNFYTERVVELGERSGFDTTAAVNLNFDFSEMSYAYKEYIAAEGQEQGLYDIYKTVTSKNTGTPGDVPGTDPNDETDYYIVNNGGGESSYKSTEIKYLPNEKLTQFTKDNTQVLPESSSMAITLNRVNTVRESDEAVQTALTELNIDFEEYCRRNSRPVLIGEAEADAELLTQLQSLFRDATNIPTDRITVLAYDVYNYIPNETVPFDWSIIFRILLAVLIVGLLLFVLLRGMRPEEVVEQEPELSIEQLLATTKENQSLEDIEISEKSETLRLIEKLIDENPQAVANLLRNWLEDDWG
jgi:flagellar M-ring protein FliF